MKAKAILFTGVNQVTLEQVEMPGITLTRDIRAALAEPNPELITVAFKWS